MKIRDAAPFGQVDELWCFAKAQKAVISGSARDVMKEHQTSLMHLL